ncbi:hypothetical protein IU433_26945 [Nocardia puris]|uniref:hypothetical protein n=1 Tax=Nocardia puris TaxID=208602 RepID=UPI000837762E|nr:hypothetical protein [Nocardia puris]MBF6213030.1 hypothetical protein [Nocardia puris]MBF6368021.1 hypothetical protein [Nocardia puris]MBF6462654.1 hypothetical protein [Nocardia puris]
MIRWARLMAGRWVHSRTLVFIPLMTATSTLASECFSVRNLRTPERNSRASAPIARAARTVESKRRRSAYTSAG